MRTYDAVQECHSCGKRFTIRYYENGCYDYLDTPCECEDAFTPVGGEPSISEWLESLKR